MTRLIKITTQVWETLNNYTPGTAWINPARISDIAPGKFTDGIWYINVGRGSFTVSRTEAERIIAEINGESEAAAAPAPAPAADEGILVHIETMTQDSFYSKTAQAARRMWRCTTQEGISFNIFDHIDHRNTYALFAEYHLWMDDMNPGDKLDWRPLPVLAYVKRNGDFYNPIRAIGLFGSELKPTLTRAAGDDDDRFDFSSSDYEPDEGIHWEGGDVADRAD